MRVTATTMLAVLCLATACGGSLEEPGQRDEIGIQHQALINGTPDAAHRSVGLLLGDGGICTGNLIGSRTVITAGHCLVDGLDTFRLAGRTYKLVERHVHPGFHPDPRVKATDDIGIARLDRAPDVAPTPIAVRAPEAGHWATLLGFGSTGERSLDSGRRRMARHPITEVTRWELRFVGTDDDVGNLCFGDSGGPSFAEVDGVKVQVGVHAYILGACGDEGRDARVDAYAKWIVGVAGGDVLIGGSGGEDKQPPIVAVTAANANGRQHLAVLASASDDVGVATVVLKVDGVTIGSLSSAPFAFEVDLDLGPHEIVAEAVDAAGNRGSETLSVSLPAPGDLLSDQADQAGTAEAMAGCSAAGRPAGLPLLLLALLWLRRRRLH